MKYLLSLLLVGAVIHTCAQEKRKEKRYRIRTIAFYNLENLFDTIDDPLKFDEISPIIESKENHSKLYWTKINNMGFVISQIGLDKTQTSPAIIGVAEVENKAVLEDLIRSEHLKNRHYEIIHYDSPDRRGIDVALLYQPKYFNPIHHESINPNIYWENKKVYTRDQLFVSGYLDDELIHIIVNHWPSRRGGESKSRPLREKAAYQNTRIIEKIRERDKNAKIFIMGDFNDDPNNSSIKKVLRAIGNREKVTEKDIYNPYEILFKRGMHTLGFRGNINLFDMIFISSPLLNTKKKDFSSYKMFQAKIFNKPFLITRRGRYQGYPYRSFSNGSFTNGYSDHYPVYMYVIKEEK